MRPRVNIVVLLLFWGLWYLTFSSRALLSPLLPMIEDEFAIGHAFAGGIFFFYSVGATAALLLSGFLPVRIGYKWSIISCFLILISALFSMGYVESYALFAVLAFFLGVGFGLYVPCAIPLITTVFNREHWGKAISFHETAPSFSLLTIPLLAAYGLGTFQWRTLFVILSGAGLVVIFVFWGFSPDPRPKKEQRAHFTNVAKRKEFWLIAAVWALAAIDCNGIYNILPLYLVKERGMDPEFANKLFGVSRIGGLFIVIVVGFVLDRFRIKGIMLVTLFLTGATTMGLAFTKTLWLLGAVLFFQATFSVLFFPVGLVAISRLTSLSERSIFTGMLMAMTGVIGNGLAPFLLGMVAEVWNFELGIFCAGVLTLGGCFLVRVLDDD